MLFEELEKIHHRPKPFEFYTAEDLWTNKHTSKQMLSYHLNPDVDLSSRNEAFIDRSVEWITSRFSLGPGKTVADFGCGPGLYTTRLACTGAHVTGIDFSARSIEYARDVAAQEGLDIRYVNHNYLDFETDSRFDLIIMIMCDFCPLSPSQRKHLLGIFYRHLRPQGAVLLDVHSLNAFDQREESAQVELNQLNGFWSPVKYYGFVNTFKYDAEKVVLDKYTIVEANRTRTVYNWLQNFSPESLTQEFQEGGFEVDATFADVAGTPFNPASEEFALVATRA